MPLKLLGCIATLFLLASCSKVKENLKPVELQPIEATATFKKMWSTTIGKGQDSRYTRLQPLLIDNILYAVDVKGKVFALDALSGKTLWRVKVKSQIGGGVGYSNNQLLLGTLKGEVIALSQTDGTELWRTQLSSEVLSAPSGNGDVVVAKTIDGRLFALDAKDGVLRWSYDHPVPVLTLRAQAAPVVEGDNTYVAFDNGQILAFASANGQLRWSARVGQPKGKTEIERLVDVDTTPIIAGPFVYSAGYQSRIVAINRGTGRLNWAQDVSTFHQILEAKGKIVVSDADSHIKAFDATTGTLAWETDKLHRRGISAPGILNGNIIVTDFEGYVHALDIDTGEFVARAEAKMDTVFAQPVTGDNTLFIVDGDGTLKAYEINIKNNKNKEHKKTSNTQPSPGTRRSDRLSNKNL